MAIKYCSNCKQNVDAHRKIGIGTLLLCIFTSFFWILIIPFYSKKCPICHGTDLTSKI